MLADGTVREHREDRTVRSPGQAASASRRRSATRCSSASTEAAPSCAVAVRLDCRIDGIGVDPTARRCSGRPGPTTAGRRAPSTATPPAASTSRARSSCTCRPATSRRWSAACAPAGCGPGSSSRRSTARPTPARPTLSSVDVAAVGATVAAVHAELVPGEVLGDVRGRARPAASACAARRCSSAPGRSSSRCPRATAGRPGRPSTTSPRAPPTTRTACVDPASGGVELGPVVRLADGSVRQHGAVPPAGAVLRVRAVPAPAAVPAGNVAAGVLARPALVDPVRRAGGEPLPGARRPGRRDPRRGPRPRRARGAQPRPRGHRRGLRAPRPRRGARAGPGPLRARRGRPSRRRAAARRTGAR